MFNLTLSWPDKARLHRAVQPLFESGLLCQDNFVPDGVRLSHTVFWALVSWLQSHGYWGLADMLLLAL